MALVKSVTDTTTADSYQSVQPLKYGGNGREASLSVVIDPATVTADARGIKTVKAGTVLVKMSSGANIGAYGPYDSGATDGRQTLGTAPNCVVCTADVNLTVDPDAGVYKPADIGGWYAYAEFNFAQLTTNTATITALRTAMPLCVFHAS